MQCLQKNPKHFNDLNTALLICILKGNASALLPFRLWFCFLGCTSSKNPWWWQWDNDSCTVFKKSKWIASWWSSEHSASKWFYISSECADVTKRYIWYFLRTDLAIESVGIVMQFDASCCLLLEERWVLNCYSKCSSLWYFQKNQVFGGGWDSTWKCLGFCVLWRLLFGNKKPRVNLPVEFWPIFHCYCFHFSRESLMSLIYFGSLHFKWRNRIKKVTHW